MSGQHGPETQKGANDGDAGLHGYGAVQHGGEHQGSVLGEGIGDFSAPTPADV
jgi:hypothetical protein